MEPLRQCPRRRLFRRHRHAEALEAVEAGRRTLMVASGEAEGDHRSLAASEVVVEGRWKTVALEAAVGDQMMTAGEAVVVAVHLQRAVEEQVWMSLEGAAEVLEDRSLRMVQERVAVAGEACPLLLRC